MPITPFNDLVNPHSVGKQYMRGDSTTISTGTGYAVIVRLVTIMTYQSFHQGGNTYQHTGGNNEFNVHDGDLGLSGINTTDWICGAFNTNGSQPGHPTYTAFLSFDDYVNSDMSTIADSPLMWEKGQIIQYWFESKDPTWIFNVNGAVHPSIAFGWEIIEVVDEATYNSGAGVPQGINISEATYGEIPVGTITATPADPNCNGCSDIYDNLGIKNRQGELQHLDPYNYLSYNGPYGGNNAVTAPLSTLNRYDTYYQVVDGVNTLLEWDFGMTRGFVVGGLFARYKAVRACRDPQALNYDRSTSPVYNSNYTSVNDPTNAYGNGLLMLAGTQNISAPQQDCAGDPQWPDSTQSGFGPYNSPEMPQNCDCCLYDITGPPPGSGSGAGVSCPDDNLCGCTDPNAANYCGTCIEDCSGVSGTADQSCCQYFHLWKICGEYGPLSDIDNFPSIYVNFTGDPSTSGNAQEQNTAGNNTTWMDYLSSLPGAPGPITVGDTIRLEDLGNPGNWYCMEYMGASQHTSDYWDDFNGGSGTGLHWNSNNWQYNPPALDGNGELIIETCEDCIQPEEQRALRFEVCDGIHQGEIINLINTWAADPQYENDNNNPQNPNLLAFGDAIDCSGFFCTLCNQPGLLVGMVLQVTHAETNTEYCLRYLGSTSAYEGSGNNGWVQGIGTGTDNYLKINPLDPLQLMSIHDNCLMCGDDNAGPCIPICTDPLSPNYVPGPWSISQCECNGDTIGTQGPGWNDCCAEDPCDDLCNDPLANNYNPSAVGCCGSGPGIGQPIDEFIGGICANTDTIANDPMTTSTFNQYMTLQANGMASLNVAQIQYENMDSPWLGQPTPPDACTGPNGGYMTSFSQGDGWVPDATIAADINSVTPNQIYVTWDMLIGQCITAGVTGVTTQTTLDELNILLTAWNPNGPGTPVSVTPPTPVVCTCAYASYAPNNDCCTYNWKCVPAVDPFAQDWPTQDSPSIQGKVRSEYNVKFGPVVTDINPRPESTFNHINNTGWEFPGLAYLRVPLIYSNFLNLGLHFNKEINGQGWAGGKQPKISYVDKYPQEWSFSYAFMQALTDGSISNGPNIDLTKAYYKVKTNMISITGSFLNGSAKVITESRAGGTAATGLYNHIIPAGAITIPKEFKSTFPTIAGRNFKTWNTFIAELKNYGLPAGVITWQSVSEFVISKAADSPGIDSHSARLAAPEFVPSTMQWMTQSDGGCDCLQDPLGPFLTQWNCENDLTIDGVENCCACVYGCTDPTASNYNPLATCDDGSCVNCDPFIVRFCIDDQYNYYRAYLDDGSGQATPQNCANSQALISAWGMQNFWDLVHVAYFPAGQDPVEYCLQWVDPNDAQYLEWLNTNSTTAFIAPVEDIVSANFVYTAYQGNDPDNMCELCGGTPGCTDPTAINYNVNATVDDGSCVYCIYGCMDSTPLSPNGYPDINGHGTNASYDCSVSTTVPTSPDLCPYPCVTGYAYDNYNPCATCEDNSCTGPEYHKWRTCGDVTIIAIHAPGTTYNDIFAQDWFYDYVAQPAVGETINIANAGVNDCYEYMGTDTSSPATGITPIPQLSTWEYNQNHNTDCTSCQCIYGCTDAGYCNYDAAATCDDGSCCNETGCRDPQAFNYCPTCCCDGPCEAVKEGCMDPTATNYDPLANTACPYCCEYIIYGCTDPTAINYDPTATVNQVSETDTSNPCQYLDQCKREIKEYGADPTKKLTVECDFASDVYKEYRKERYGLSNYCGSDLPDHLHEKELCDWEDRKRPAYLSSVLTVLATYEYPIVDGEPYWKDPLRPAWTETECGLTSDVDIDLYFFYDTTSMGLAAIQQQRNAVDDWVDGFVGRDIPKFEGEIYHVLTAGERWIDWATTIFTGIWNNAGTCGGKDSYCVVNSVPADFGDCINSGRSDAVAPTDMTPTSIFWAPMAWGNGANKPWYSSAPLGYNNGGITHLGYPPALTKREVLGVMFADEASTLSGTGSAAQPYHTLGGSSYGTQTWASATDGTGTAGDGSDAVLTACYKADYDKYIEKYKEHIAKGPLHKATMVIYPAKPLGVIYQAHRGFPLHALGAVSSGNNTPKDGRYANTTAPINSLVDLSKIEVGNPYWDTPNPNQPASHTYGYGGLDNYGWAANVAESTFDKETFEADLEEYWDPNKLKCDGTECIIVTVVNQNNVAVPNYDIYVDGGFVGKTDEFGRLRFQIENAAVKTHHTINLCLCLETKGNCRQQNVKIVVQEECAPACCDTPSGVSCEPYEAPVNQVFEGCTDPNASNYNPTATIDDGSCEYCDPPIIISETHIDASTGVNNGTISTTVTNGTLPYTYSWTGPGGYSAAIPNITGLAGGVYNLTVTDANNCTAVIIVNLDQPPIIFGCMKDDVGYWPNINGLNQAGALCNYPCTDDGLITGTPNGYQYFCYNPDATDPDECCEAGCTDPNAVTGGSGPGVYCPGCNYDCNMEPIGTFNMGWDSCCELCNEGCMDPVAGNFDSNATCACIDCCEYYWICDDGGWTINQIDQYNYPLSGYNSNGIYVDNTGDMHSFLAALAIYYSSASMENIFTASEVTAVQNASMSYLPGNPCPLCTIDSYYYQCENMPLGSIGGYTTENPWGATATNSCYAQLQVAQFGSGYVFPNWEDYREWHNGTGGPNLTCSGSQIPVLNAGQDISYANTLHDGINGGGSTPFNPDNEDNWVYYTLNVPICDGYTGCDCIQVLTAGDNNGDPGVYPTEILCDADIETCCGEPPAKGGCIDNGYVGLHADFGTYGATTEQDWWDGLNAAGISYSQNNNPMSICLNGIVHEEAVINGGSGVVGTGMGGLYPVGIPAYNYDPSATYDDGSCCYCAGCIDEYGGSGSGQGVCFDDPELCGSGSGSGSGEGGCMDPAAITYVPSATVHTPSTCDYSGCLMSGSINYGYFEVNNQPTYEWSGNPGYVYDINSIIAGCTSCCIMTTNLWGCVSCNLQNPEFFDGNNQLITPTFANRIEATTEWQVNQNGNGCQTMFSANSSYDDNQNIFYMWSHGGGTAVEHFNDWYFWFAINVNAGACIMTQSHMDNLYSQTGWTSPAGTNSFTIGSQSPWDNNLFSWTVPQIISGIQIVRDGSTIIHEVSYTDSDTTWETFRNTLITQHGFDGQGTNPDLTGLDFDQMKQAFQNTNYTENIILATCINQSTEEKMCLQTITGTHNNCDDCVSNANCGQC